MEVSNSTGADTGVRTGSGTPPKIIDKESLIIIAPGGVVKMPDPPCCPFTIEFWVKGEVVAEARCEAPMQRLSFLRPGRSGKYQVRRFRQPPQRRMPPAGNGQRTAKRA